MAVWVIVNIEEWNIDETMPRTVLTPPAGGAPSPDIPNWAWHEYGNRVGFWRLLKTFDELSVTGVLAINGTAVEFLRADQPGGARPRLGVHGPRLQPEEHAEGRRRTIRYPQNDAEAIETFTGKRPRGWLGPGLTETWETPDLLVEEGYDYVADWVLDDQPVTLKTRTDPIVNVPYTQECNDVAMMLIQHHPAREYYQRASDQFNQIYEDSADQARVMALVVHPYIMGAPHRARYFRDIMREIAAKDDVAFMDRRTDLRLVSGRKRRLGHFPALAEGQSGADMSQETRLPSWRAGRGQGRSPRAMRKAPTIPGSEMAVAFRRTSSKSTSRSGGPATSRVSFRLTSRIPSVSPMAVCPAPISTLMVASANSASGIINVSRSWTSIVSFRNCIDREQIDPVAGKSVQVEKIAIGGIAGGNVADLNSQFIAGICLNGVCQNLLKTVLAGVASLAVKQDSDAAAFRCGTVKKIDAVRL